MYQNYCKSFSNVVVMTKSSRFQILQKIKSSLVAPSNLRLYSMPGSQPGSGAGKGGGAGGSVKEAGGGLGKFAAANEEGYFHNKQRRQLQKIRKKQKKSDPQKPEN